MYNDSRYYYNDNYGYRYNYNPKYYYQNKQISLDYNYVNNYGKMNSSKYNHHHDGFLTDFFVDTAIRDITYTIFDSKDKPTFDNHYVKELSHEFGREFIKYGC
jgi:hypothetical protein